MGILKRIAIFIVIVGMMVCFGVNAQENPEIQKAETSQPEVKTIKHIIFITVDGLSEERLKSAYTPNINGLAASGIKTTAIGVLPANSLALTASLLAGADPSVHGLTQPGQRIKTQLLPEIVCRYGRSSAFVSPVGFVQEGFFNREGENVIRSYEVKGIRNDVLVSKVIDVFNKNRPYFLGAQLPGICKETVTRGDKTQIALEVSDIDEQLGRLLSTLRSYGVYDECLIVIAGNYGKYLPQVSAGQEYGRELMVPVVLAGPGLKTGTILPPVKIIDIAPTTALLAGLQTAPESNGMVLWNALRSGTGFLEENLLLKRVKDLSEENIESTDLIYRLTEEKRLVKSEKESFDKEKIKIQKTIEGKDGQIRFLKWQVRYLKLVELVTILAMGTGYAIEYFYLRKKFLMF